MAQLLKQSQFREDLYYRLAVVRIDLPSLEERRDDIPLLVRHFLRRFNEKNSLAVTIDPSAVRLLEQMRWPGNVREFGEHREPAGDLRAYGRDYVVRRRGGNAANSGE